jgi:hypothetical protein
MRDRARFDEWMRIQRDAGSTHAIVNLPAGEGEGPSYGGIWQEPDFAVDGFAVYVEFLQTLLATPSASGKGFTPIVVLDHGGADPLPRIRALWPGFARALRQAGILDRIIGILAFEPVIGDWTSREVSEGLTLAHALFPEMILGYHGSPTRWAGSSNPVEADDPWQGAEAGFFERHGGEHIDLFCYQTPHGRELYAPCVCPRASERFGHEDHCWLNRWEDGVARLGAGYHGWRRMPVVLMETVAYEYIRGQATSEDARRIATLGQGVAAKWGLRVGQGNGLPW